MTETKNTETQANSPIDMVLGLVDGIVRGGLSIVSIPLGLLPAESNKQIRQAISNVATTVLEVPKELSKASEGFVDQIMSGSGEIRLPRVEEIGERAREFTDRMAKAAQDVGNAVTTSVSSATEGAGQADKKVDQWVEKKK